MASTTQHPTLGVGSSGPTVGDLQERLWALGLYHGPINAKFTPDTAAAVVVLQQKSNLSRVHGGMYGADWEALATLESQAPPRRAKAVLPQKSVSPPLPPLAPSGSGPSGAHPILGQTMSGPAVSDLQNRLAALGLYKGKISGYYSPDTALAVVAIQRESEIKPINGGMGNATWIALEALEKKGGAAPAAVEPGEQRVTSPVITIGIPPAATLLNPKWVTKGGAKTSDLYVEAPGQNGVHLDLRIEAWEGGEWKQVAATGGVVQGGALRVPMPALPFVAEGTLLRFQASSAGSK